MEKDSWLARGGETLTFYRVMENFMRSGQTGDHLVLQSIEGTVSKTGKLIQFGNRGGAIVGHAKQIRPVELKYTPSLKETPQEAVQAYIDLKMASINKLQLQIAEMLEELAQARKIQETL